MFEIIRAKLTSKHLNDIFIGDLESKKPVDWPKISTICMKFELLRRNTKCLFPTIGKGVVMILSCCC